MTSLSTRPIEDIGYDEPSGIKPDEHDLFELEDSEQEESDTEATLTDQDAETSSEISEIDVPSVFIFKKKKPENPQRTYTVILQEEDFLPE